VLRWALERRRRSLPPAPPPDAFPLETPRVLERLATHKLTATWVGHSTVLLQIGELNVLTDPIWSERASPVSFAGPTRVVAPALPFDELPSLDLILLSHNHYDHLDRATVERLAGRFPEAHWAVPLGLGTTVAEWGARSLHELDWWTELRIRGIVIGCTPAQHFSARGLGDRGKTLWCGWTVATEHFRVYFAGDTAYHPEFPRVAERYGPFDLVLLPIGAYEPRWFMRSVHMDPDEAVRAYQELAAVDTRRRRAAMLPIHWGTFQLTDEPMDEPPRRVAEQWGAARLAHDRLWLLRHGETRRMRKGG
jgi:L-ascorbate metabolism protein UlaG (beta-lactamase superfamily)